MSSQVLVEPTPVKIGDPNEQELLEQIGEIALEFIHLRSDDESGRRGSTGKKAPYQQGKKHIGEPGLLRAEEGEFPPSELTASELPASLPQLGGAQSGASQASGDGEVTDAAAGPPPPPAQVPPSRAIAERLKAIGDQVDKDIRDETRKEFMNLLLKESVFSITKEQFKMTCAVVLANFQQRFRSGWAQISVVYDAMLHLISIIRQQEAADASRQTRIRQVTNFVGPTMTELGLLSWVVSHGGMEHVSEGADDVVIIESSVDPEK